MPLPKKWAIRVDNQTTASVTVIVRSTTTDNDFSYAASEIEHINQSVGAGSQVDGATITETDAPIEINGQFDTDPASNATGIVQCLLINLDDADNKPIGAGGAPLASTTYSNNQDQRRITFRY